MAELLNNELLSITNYELDIEKKKIVNKSVDFSCQISDSLKVVSILNKYLIDYTMDNEYNFLLFPYKKSK